MLDKIWRFLKQLIQRLFGTNPIIEPTPPQPGPTLTDAEYEAKLMELLERVNQGWGRGDVAEFLIAKQIKNGDLAAWLRRFGDRLLEGAQGSTASTDAVVSLQELARRLELLGGVAGGKLGECAGKVGREILVEFPLVSDEVGEDVDGEAEVWKKRGNEQLNLRDFEGALNSYEKALEIKPDFHEAWNNRGIALHNLHRLEDEIASYEKALEIKPDFHEAWNNWGGALHNLGRFEDAMASYEKILEIKPDFHKAWNNRGLTLGSLGRLEEAIASYDKALEFKPDYHEIWNNRGSALGNLGLHEDAIASYDKAFEIIPDDDTAWFYRGLAMDNLGLFEKAIASYDKALEFTPDYYATWYNRAMALVKLGKLEEAITSFDKALKLKPDLHAAWYSRGIALNNLERLKESIASFDKALEIKPDDYASWFNRGVILGNLVELNEAIASYDKALEIKPDYHEAWINRGSAVSNAPRHNQVVYEILQGEFPNSPPVMRTILIHNLKHRGYEGIIFTLEAGLEYYPQNTHPEGYGELHKALGDTHYNRGKLNDPNTYWNKATTSYKEALKTLTPDAFLKLHLEVLQKLIRTLVNRKETEQANKLRRDATDLLKRLLQQQNYSQLTQQQLTDKLVSFEQLTVNIFIESGQFDAALATAETDKNVCLSWLLDALPTPDYETEETVTHAQIQQLLNPKTAAIYWHLSDAALTTFIIKSDGLLSPETCFSDFPDEFEEWVKEWNQQYTDYQSKEKKSQVNHPWRGGMASKFARLNAILKIDVIEQQLEGITELILIPHRDLHRFPIHALFSRDFVVSYLPSAKLGITLKDRFLAKAKEKAREANFILSIENPDSVIDQNGEPQAFPPLPAAEIESEMICRMFFPNSTRRKKEDSPTLDEVETLLLQQPHNIFHFTGHGSYNFDDPLESTLYLSNTHRLTVREIIKHNLSNYELICLPACETALTDKQTILAEYVGLTSGFMRAGVGCVVSTLWPIESGASTLLMIYFYQRWREAGDSLPVALANAQKWLRESTREDLAAWYQGEIDKITGNSSEQSEDEAMLIESLKSDQRELDKKEHQPYKHPYYWAAFTITGLS